MKNWGSYHNYKCTYKVFCLLEDSHRRSLLPPLFRKVTKKIDNVPEFTPANILYIMKNKSRDMHDSYSVYICKEKERICRN